METPFVCPICRDDITEEKEINSLPFCNHKFCISCCEKWFKKSSSCPLCRSGPMEPSERSVTPEDSVVSYVATSLPLDDTILTQIPNEFFSESSVFFRNRLPKFLSDYITSNYSSDDIPYDRYSAKIREGNHNLSLRLMRYMVDIGMIYFDVLPGNKICGDIPCTEANIVGLNFGNDISIRFRVKLTRLGVSITGFSRRIVDVDTEIIANVGEVLYFKSMRLKICSACHIEELYNVLIQHKIKVPIHGNITNFEEVTLSQVPVCLGFRNGWSRENIDNIYDYLYVQILLAAV